MNGKRGKTGNGLSRHKHVVEKSERVQRKVFGKRNTLHAGMEGDKWGGEDGGNY